MGDHYCKHIAEVGLADKINNNKVERLHNTIRERNKVMRGLFNPETSKNMLDAHRVYYNFVRPHMALDGKTPSEMAGIDLKLGNDKWLGLIKKSLDTPPY
ncbi:MAG: integrase core domain-containing protein [Candidatus Hydrothermarchaeales archaeon]